MLKGLLNLAGLGDAGRSSNPLAGFDAAGYGAQAVLQSIAAVSDAVNFPRCISITFRRINAASSTVGRCRGFRNDIHVNGRAGSDFRPRGRRSWVRTLVVVIHL